MLRDRGWCTERTAPKLHDAWKPDPAWVGEMDAEPKRLGYCYFIGNDRFVKIGFSADPWRRVSEIANGSGLFDVEILALARGHRFREAYHHQQFDAFRLGGEWFTRCPEIEAEIERLSSLSLQAAA